MMRLLLGISIGITLAVGGISAGGPMNLLLGFGIGILIIVLTHAVAEAVDLVRDAYQGSQLQQDRQNRQQRDRVIRAIYDDAYHYEPEDREGEN